MRTLGWLVIVVLGSAGCAGDAGPPPPPSVAFVTPGPGASFMRDQLGSSGALVANVGVELDIGGDVARVAITAGDVALGDVAEAKLAAELAQSGPVTLTATALDDNDAPLATATVDITIDDPMVADCKGWLDLYQLQYTSGPAMLGVADPVTVTLPLNGVAYRYSGNTSQRKTLFGDCTLMKSLAQAAPIVRSHDVQEIVDLGIYNYRCIDQTKMPPNCSMSQHAYAKAIDIAELVTGDGTHYSVLDDWVIDPTGMTCTAATENDKDAWLHQLICELKAARTWNIVLTPNYSAAHRDHFHVDLTKDADFIKRGHDDGVPLDF